MVKKINPDGSRTIYIGWNYEVRKNSGGLVTGNTTYYPTAGAMRVDGTVYYTLGEPCQTHQGRQLGSTSVVTNASGTVMGDRGTIPLAGRAIPPTRYIPTACSSRR